MESDADIQRIEGIDIYPRSSVQRDGAVFFLAQECATGRKFLGIQGAVEGFDGQAYQVGNTRYYSLTPANAQALRSRMPWLNPVPGGLKLSFGFGDRLGLATPGHALSAWEAKLYPIFAQQSVRENARTKRTPQQVVDEAMWGLFQTGWGKPWGADADHLKTPQDLPAFVAAGYTFYTVDPGEHVGKPSASASPHELRDQAAGLPWADLDSTLETCLKTYLSQPFRADELELHFTEPELLRAIVKYGGAIAHTVRMYRELTHLMDGKPFDFEVSVDETDSPTSILEHAYIASELRRLGVQWNSLAPRFPGKFEKGVDFQGDLQILEHELAQHAAIVRAFGTYKLSLHSGSDKFSVYSLLAKYAGDCVHVKTAGTSYLEALRVAAEVEPAFFRQILAYAIQRYPTDRATYHVSAELSRVPPAEGMADADLPDLLEDFHARQVLHVTFGSALDRFGEHLKHLLLTHEPEYNLGLQKHFDKHISPFLGHS